MVIGVRQRGQPRTSSSTHATHDAQKRWWPQGTSAWRASRSSTRQTSQRSGGCTAADAATLLLAVGTSSASSVLSESDCSIPSHGTCAPKLRLTARRNWIRVYPPLSKRCRQAWSVHRLSDFLASWRDGSALHDSVVLPPRQCRQ